MLAAFPRFMPYEKQFADANCSKSAERAEAPTRYVARAITRPPPRSKMYTSPSLLNNYIKLILVYIATLYCSPFPSCHGDIMMNNVRRANRRSMPHQFSRAHSLYGMFGSVVDNRVGIPFSPDLILLKGSSCEISVLA